MGFSDIKGLMSSKQKFFSAFLIFIEMRLINEELQNNRNLFKMSMSMPFPLFMKPIKSRES